VTVFSGARWQNFAGAGLSPARLLFARGARRRPRSSIAPAAIAVPVVVVVVDVVVVAAIVAAFG
jgi:hypothetical protein